MVLPKAAVLVVADQENRKYYENLPLASEDVVLAGHGEALCAMLRRNVDLILLDCGFHPQMGIGILKDMRKRHPRVPVLFATERSSEEIAIEAFRSGVRCYLRKPFDPLGLRDLIRKLLEVKRQSRETRQGLHLEDIWSEGCVWPKSGETLPESVMKVLNFIEFNYQKPLTVNILAEIACVSPQHFSRIFRQTVGMAPLRYVKYLRIQHAKELLKDNHLQVFSVAVRVGFGDVSNFNKNFRKFEGVSPSQYRDHLKIGRGTDQNTDC